MLTQTTGQNENGPQIAIAVALLVSYCIYAVLYVAELFHPITTVAFGNTASKAKPLLENTKKDDNATEEPKEEPPRKASGTDNALSSWVVKGYHQNIFFYTVSCLIALMSYKSAIMVVLVYAGLIGKVAQAVGLYLSKEFVCKVSHGCVVGLNFLMLIISIANYE